MERLVAAVLVVATAGGCSKYIKVDRRVERIEVRRFEDPEVVSAQWGYDADVSVSLDGDKQAVRVAATRFKTCTHKAHIVFREIEVTDRHWRSATTKGWVHVTAVLGLGMLATGLVSQYVLDNSPTKMDDLGESSLTGTGIAQVVGGGFALWLVPFAIGTDLLAIDSSKELGEKDRVTPTETRCKAEPAAGANVKFANVEGTTNDNGVFEAALTNDDILLEGGALVRVEGQTVASHALVERRERVIAEAAADRERASQAEQLAAVNRVSDEEIAAGRCNQQRAQLLQQVMGGFQQIFGDGTQGLVILDNALVVANPGGQPVPFSFNLSGQYHIFSVGFSPSRLIGGMGGSPFEIGLRNMTGADMGSTVVQAAPSNRPNLSYSGRGCTLLVLTKAI